MCNPAVKKIFGYDIEEVINKNTDMLFYEQSNNMDLSHDIHKILEEEGFHVSIANGKKKDGKIINLEIITGRLKHTKGAVLLIRDMTLLQETARKHRRGKELLRLITENMDDLVAVLDTEGRRLYNSPSYRKIFPDLESIKNTDSFAEIHPDDRQKVKEIFNKTVETGVGLRAEFRFLLENGEERFIESQGSTIKDESGNVSNVIVVSRDVTDRKRTEEELKNSFNRLQKTIAETVQAMATIVETRDPYTSGHQKRVAYLARTIAEQMGLSDEILKSIEMSGIIHDIGKIAVPVEILSKPTRLSKYEFEIIKAHSRAGYDILKDIDFPWPIADIVLQHHERLDGSGYPKMLKDDNILLQAKIISVADVVEAIASNRPYRPALGIDVALEEIEKAKGILYDSEIVEICVNLFREKRFKFD